jgi:acetyl esterase/lipase
MTNASQGLIDSLTNNNHYHLVEPAKLKELQSYLDINLIPNEYKKDWSYYSQYDGEKFLPVSPLDKKDPLMVISAEDRNNIIDFLTSPIAWPGFANDKALVGLPQSYVIICEMDILKDEGLIYAQRLKNVGVKVDIAYYKSTFHGVIQQLDAYSEANIILEDMCKYIEDNI